MEISSLEHISDGKIYSYNSTSNPQEITFSTANNKNYGFSSISLVKFGNEVNIILVAGQECDLEEKTEEIKISMTKVDMFRHRNHLHPSDEYELRAMPLSESCPLFKCIVLARIDLATQTFDARYIYEDWGQSYHGVTDDVSAFLDTSGKFINKEAEEFVKKMPEVLNQHQALFELCKTCLLLPGYFEQFSEDVTVERHPTEYINFRSKLKNRKAVSSVSNAYKIPFRQPYVLLRESRQSPTRVGFVTPEMNIESSGYWKKLPVQSQGIDKNGKPITGRTWVIQTLSWSETNDNNAVLSVKRNKHNFDSENPGYIYVMRSAAHQKDVFKVGLTKRDAEARSKELGRSTSSPDHFLVVEEWYVSDCVLAERLIHEKLKEYRVNPKREYFKARYNIIFSAIDEVIHELEIS